MKKFFLMLFLISLISISIFAYTGPNVLTPFKQTSWAGGAGQYLVGDETMFLESERMFTDSGSVTLDYIEDTSFSVLSAYPPVAAGTVSIVNGIFEYNDTIFAFTGQKANISYTTNAGAIWTSYDTLPVSQSQCEVLDAEYVNGVTYASGYYGGLHTGFFAKSYDKKTWASGIVGPAGVSNAFDILHIIGDTFLLATGDFDGATANMDGAVFRSFDGCSTWTEADTISYAVITKLVKASGDTIFACGDNMLSGQPIMISIDGGDTWAPTGTVDPIYDSLLGEGEASVILTLANINNYIYAGSWAGELYRSDYTGAVWEKLDTNNAISDSTEITGIYSFDGDSVIYVTTYYPAGLLYKSYDGGYTMMQSDSISDTKVQGMAKIATHTYVIGVTTSADGGKLYIDSYFKNGYLISSAFDVDKYDVIKVSDYFDLYEIRAMVVAPRFSSCTLKIRSASDTLMSDATSWDLCPAYVLTLYNGYYQGKTLDSIASVVSGQSFIQYRFDFTRTGTEVTPVLDSIWLQKVAGVEVLKTESVNADFEIKRVSQTKYLITTSSKTGNVKLYDIAGRMVANNLIVNGKATLILDVPAGSYSIRIYDDKGLIGKKQITLIK